MSNEYSDEAMLREFLAEAEEHFELLEHDLLELEQACEDGRETPRELLDEMFRATHTLKGLASMFDFLDVKTLAHACENVFDGLRSGALALDAACLEALFAGVDGLKSATASAGRGEADDATGQALAAIRAFLATGGGVASAPRREDVAAQLRWSEMARGRLDAAEPGQRAYVLGLRWGIELRQGSLTPELLGSSIDGEVLDTRVSRDPADPAETLDLDTADVLVEVLVLSPRSAHDIADALGVAASRIATADAGGGATASDEVKGGVDGSERETVAKKPAQIVRVDIRRLDELMDLMGELVTSRTRLTDLSSTLRDSYPKDEAVIELVNAVKDMSMLFNGVQERVMGMRMVPVGQLFSKFPRAVRDIARSQDKEIRLALMGEETELDKRLIEQIEDPLLHLLRNACDHGIEVPYEREQAGKPRQGTVTLAASHEGGHIVLEVSDDGKGLALDRIAERASQLEEFSGELDAETVAEVIMSPGFSTADTVTDVSGRGVGLDVVRRRLIEMGGTVEVESQPGTGTSFRMRLPLTLAIVPALLVRVGGCLFCVPLSVVSEVLRVHTHEIATVKGATVLDLRGETLPLVNVGELLRVGGGSAQASKYFVVEVVVGAHRIGLLVDELAGRQEIVVKNLEDALGDTPGISGATILGDGSVAPILDVERIARLARIHRHEKVRSAHAEERLQLPTEAGVEAGAQGGED